MKSSINDKEISWEPETLQPLKLLAGVEMIMRRTSLGHNSHEFIGRLIAIAIEGLLLGVAGIMQMIQSFIWLILLISY